MLGALANATRRLGLMTAVTCPTIRYHPAIVAQSAATLGLLSDNRFTLGLGAGERLNEHIVGARRPGRAERHKRLAEAIEIIQGLLAGTLSNYRGSHFRLDHARLFDRPDRKPLVAIAADGGAARRPRRRSADRDRTPCRSGRGLRRRRRPTLCEVATCYAKHEEDARKIAHKYFRWSLTGWPVVAELVDTEGFAAASKSVSLEAVAKQLSCGPSVELHLQTIERYVQAGFDHIIRVQVGPEQQAFIEFFERQLAPALGRRKAA